MKLKITYEDGTSSEVEGVFYEALVQELARKEDLIQEDEEFCVLCREQRQLLD